MKFLNLSRVFFKRKNYFNTNEDCKCDDCFYDTISHHDYTKWHRYSPNILDIRGQWF